MKYFLVLLFCLNYQLVAQFIDSTSLFPSSVGNVWEYDSVFGFQREEIYKDSVDNLGSKYLFYKFNDYFSPTPNFFVDSSQLKVYRIMNDPIPWLYYVLDADSGDIWIVDTLFFQSDQGYMLAQVSLKYASYIYSRYRSVMTITYYQYQGDTVINQYSWPTHTITLIEGIGLYLDFDEEGGGPQKVLLGAIIEGDTIGTITSVLNEAKEPDDFQLYQNYPNPFNPTTQIKIEIANTSSVRLKVYNALGEELAALLEKELQPGSYSVSWDGKDSEGNALPSGVYLIRLSSENYSKTVKAVLLK